MAASTFLTGQEVRPTPEAKLVKHVRLSLGDGLRLLRTPSSEAGVQAYHRSLEGAPAAPQTLLAELTALREGRATRFELLASIATSPAARANGVRGRGLLLLRAARKAFLLSGVAARVRTKRASVAKAQNAALMAGASSTAPADVSRKLVLLEGAIMRLENQVFAQARAEARTPVVAALEDRVAALEAELRLRIAAEAPGSGA